MAGWLLLLGFLAAPCAADIPKPVLAGSWVCARTANVTVYSDAGERVAADLARRVERFAETLDRTNLGLQAIPPEPILVFGFRNHEVLDAYGLSKAEHAVGFFVPATDRPLIVMNTNVANRWDVLYHEFTHGYLHHNLPAVPVWLDEGLAEFYGTFVPGDLTAEIGHAHMEYVSWFADHPTAPLDAVFHATYADPDFRNSDEWRTTLYGESWALVHFMLMQPEYTPLFNRLVHELQTGSEPDSALLRLVPRDQWEKLSSRLERYLKGSLSFYEYRFSQRFHDMKVEVATITTSEMLYNLGMLLLDLRPDHVEQADEHFRAALDRDSLHAAATAGLGYVRDRLGDPSGATQLYSAAIAIAPDDARTYLLAGRGTLWRAEQATHKAGLASSAKLARSLFASCLHLDASNMEALAGYGKSCLYSADTSAMGIAAMKMACDDLPARRDLLSVLVELELAAGHVEELRLLEQQGYLKPLKPDDRFRMEAKMMQLEVREAGTLVAAGRNAEADSLLARMLLETHDSELHGIIEDELNKLRGQEKQPRAQGPH